MDNIHISIWYRLLILGIFLFLIASPVFAAPGEQPVPDGFKLVRSEGSVSLYQKGYAGGSPDYVQIADLAQGAKIGVLHGKITNSGEGQGVYGGDNAFFTRKSIQQFWRDFTNAVENAFCVTNGQFFHLADSPTPLPFPLKVDGKILTDGYGINDFPNQKLMLEIWPDRLDIRELSKDSLYNSSAPDIVAGLTEDAEKASKRAVGRTFIGIRDQNGDGQYEILMIFNTSTAKPPAAAKVLRDFGADKVMMLDGGGSTQLVCQGNAIINTDRLIPQAIGIAAGDGQLALANPQPNSATSTQSNSTNPETAAVVSTLASSSDKAGQTQPEQAVTAQTASEQTTASVSQEAGGGPNSENLTKGQISEKTPPESSGQSAEQLASQLATSTNTVIENGQVLGQSDQQSQDSFISKDNESTNISSSSTFVSSSVGHTSEQINLDYAIWIPGLMLPVVLVLIATVRRAQQNY